MANAHGAAHAGMLVEVGGIERHRPSAVFFCNISEHADGARRGRVSIGKAPKDASDPRPFRRYPPIRSSPRRSPSAYPKVSPKIDARSHRVDPLPRHPVVLPHPERLSLDGHEAAGNLLAEGGVHELICHN